MISHEHKCIFIHIPKCAGTSIESALGHFDGFEDHYKLGGQDHRSIRMIEQPLLTPNIFSSKESTIEFLRRVRRNYKRNNSSNINPRNKFTLTQEQYDSYFKFTFIRNPWARAYSWYKNVMLDEAHRKSLKIPSQLPLNDFLRLHAGKGMLKPQTYWIKNFRGSIPLDYIGRFETLAEDYQHVCKAIHISPVTLPHKTKGTSKDYREYYDDDSINIIMNIYKEEIEMFGYLFES